MVSFIFGLTYFVLTGMVACQSDLQELTQWLLRENRYDSTLYPGFENGNKTTVSVEIVPSAMYSVSDVTMDFKMVLYLHQTWLDPRLDYTSNISSGIFVDNSTRLQLGLANVDKVWRPNIYFRDEREAELQDTPRRNELMFIYPNGTVLYSIRISMKHACFMHLQKYPFDSQKCTLQIESFETFSAIAFSLTIRRKLGNYILHVFLPTIFIAILSWISFWIDPQIVHGRISLSILCVLTMVAKSSELQHNLPPLSYVLAIDVWMIICQFFVFIALMEYAYVYHAYVNVQTEAEEEPSSRPTKQNDMRTGLKNNNDTKKEGGDDIPGSQGIERNIQSIDLSNEFQNSVRVDQNESKNVKPEQKLPVTVKVNVIDKWSRIVFPVVFFIFVFVYFLVCLLSADTNVD